MIQHIAREVVPGQTAKTAEFYGELGFRQVPTPATMNPDVVWMQLTSATLRATSSRSWPGLRTPPRRRENNRVDAVSTTS